MRHFNAGASFSVKDQVATVVVGVIVALLLRHADLSAPASPTRTGSGCARSSATAASSRGTSSSTCEFPSNVRFAQLVLPGEETLAIYAVQRWDEDRAVEAMDGLRALFAATHAAPYIAVNYQETGAFLAPTVPRSGMCRLDGRRG